VRSDPNHNPSNQGNQHSQMHLVQRARTCLKDHQKTQEDLTSINEWLYTASLSALLMGGILALVSLVGLGLSFSIEWALVLLAASGLTLGSSYMLNRTHIAKIETREASDLLSQLSQRVEQVSDVQWELNDSQTRYRDLLDSQNDIIIRRDQEGILTYANKPFAHIFGSGPEAKIGNVFTPAIIGGERSPALNFKPDDEQRSYTQQLKTQNGNRWYIWEEFAVTDENLNITEIQSIGRDITEQIRAEGELQDAREQAESANKAKGQFLATISHEIRTPMNGILGMTGLMMDTNLTANQKNYCRTINSSAKSLLSLIDQILDFSKIEAGKLELDNQPFDLHETVQSGIELLAPRAHDKGLEIAWFITPDLPQIFMGDEVRLRQILTNLIGNAIKFTDKGGITIEIVDPTRRKSEKDYFEKPKLNEKHTLQITVSDTGIGLSKRAQKIIFEDFEQVDNSHARKFEGTGLGLAITQKIVKKMNGEITVDSTLGKGSTFQVTFDLESKNNAPQIYCASQLPNFAHNILITGSLEIEMNTMVATLNHVGMNAIYSPPEQALEALMKAGKNGAPFDTLIVDAQTAHARIKKLQKELENQLDLNNNPTQPIQVVLLDISERSDFPSMQELGLDAYLTRPVRALSLFSVLNKDYSNPQASPLDDHFHQDDEDVKPDESGNQSPTILLVEDNEINALLARTLLKKLGANVTHVTNGKAAVNKVKQMNEKGQTLEYILMDIHMPEMDGFAATQNIRNYLSAHQLSISKHIPIIAMTANAFSEDKEKCKKSGMDDHLAKPFESYELEEVLLKWSPRRQEELQQQNVS